MAITGVSRPGKRDRWGPLPLFRIDNSIGSAVMRGGWHIESSEARFDLPPRFALFERRMAGIARDIWAHSGGNAVENFPGHSLVLVDPGGVAVVRSVGADLGTTFRLAADQSLAGKPGLAEAIVAAGDAATRAMAPATFEAAVVTPGGAKCLLRGLALPLAAGADAGCVQVVVNWRELLGAAAMARLRQQIGAEWRRSVAVTASHDPFAPISARLSPA